MTTDTRAPSGASTARRSPPRLRPARFEDYPQIQRLEAAHEMETQPFDDWRGVWVDNPLLPRFGHRPIGWVLEDAAGRIVGSMTSVPSLYTYRGRELINVTGRAWVTAAEYRGYALSLMDQYLTQPGIDLFVNTTVSEAATPVFSKLSARIPSGEWDALAYWVTGYRGARKALEKKGVPLAGALAIPAAAALRLKDALLLKRLPAAPAAVAVEAADGFDARFDQFWVELVRRRPDTLLAVRDRQTLSWHFAIPMRRGRVWVLTASRGGLLRAYCVLKRQDLPGGVRRMRVIDYQTLEPDADLLGGLLRAALRRCAAEDLYLLEHHGCGLPKMRTLDRFAPYRQRLPGWPYYYHATDPVLDAELRNPAAWDVSAYDGDASYE